MKPNGVNPSRYDDEGQNVGDGNVGVELDGLRHDARLYRRRDWIASARESAEYWRGITMKDLMLAGQYLNVPSRNLIATNL